MMRESLLPGGMSEASLLEQMAELHQPLGVLRKLDRERLLRNGIEPPFLMPEDSPYV